VVWGEPGTNGQHAYFQMLHQGTDTIPVEFILVRQADAPGGAPALADPAVRAPLARQHRMLLANGLAQSQALMQGQASPEPHRDFPGNRPSTTLLLDALTPRSLGALLALYEHRVFTSGAVWGIDSFDQWGVELGKALGNRLLPLLDGDPGEAGGAGDATVLDASTRGLLRRLRG
jgi:glucose-6-phosphate isomerase